MGVTVALSLISHTNAGKTTLARTLLGRDVGEVRDEAHVTQEAESWPLVDTPEGDALLLWDTPGFGDSARLAKRLAQQGNPIGWFLSQVWDRFRDRTFWLTQKAVVNVRDEADVKQLIKLRTIYELLEQITDRCEDVANIIEGIVLENS